MSLYAQDTSVSVERSQAAIKKELSRYHAEAFVLGEEGSRALVQFRIKGRTVQFVLDLPDRADKRFWLTPSRKFKRGPHEAHMAWEQACRQKWRALHLFVKASLEAVHEGILDLDSAFLPYMLLANGQTVGGHMKPMIVKALESGVMPRLALPEPTNGAMRVKESP